MSFWKDLAVYCEHLAPCATPAVATVAQVANAVSNAEMQIDAIRHEGLIAQGHINTFATVSAYIPDDELD